MPNIAVLFLMQAAGTEMRGQMDDMADSFAQRLSEVTGEMDTLTAAKEAADQKTEQLTAELGSARSLVSGEELVVCFLKLG